MKTPKKQFNFWPIKVFVLALVLAIIFGVFSELVLDGASIAVCIVVLLLFLCIALFADMIGIAVTACDKVPFLSMASRKIKGAKSSIWLINRQDKVASVCCDIIGDISAIISGSVVSVLVISISTKLGSNQMTTAVLASSIIASFTVGCKAVVKSYAMKNSHNIIKIMGRFILVFGIGK